MNTGVKARWYFVALPDRDEARAVAARVATGATRVVRHASGRPWLIAHLPQEQITVGEAGADRVAVLGWSSATGGTLRREAGRAGNVAALDELSHTLDGCFSLVASVDGTTRAQGTAAGVRRVFHARIDGVTVVSDRADVLAELGGFPLDETSLTLRLFRKLPHPLAEEPLWRGVEPVPADGYVAVDRRGQLARTACWWRRPEPLLSREAGAERLRDALAGAVAARTRHGGRVHCDLSGGFDSTPITYFAAQGPADVVATTAYNRDPGGGEDLIWARRALPVMPRVVEHVTVTTESMPRFYGGLAGESLPLDDPSDAYRAAPRLLHMMRAAAAHDTRIHFNGQGGDEALTGWLKWEHTLFGTRPLLALRRIRQHQLLEGLTAREAFGGLRDRRTHRRWFTDTVVGAPVRGTGPRGQARPKVSMDWDHVIQWPAWVTRDARQAAGQRLRALARDLTPLGPDIASHAELAAIREGTRIARGTLQLGATLGMSYDAPLSDDRVIEACLAVRREERTSPLEFKPLMREAMRGLLPGGFLRRTRKTGGAAQSVRGLAEHGAELVELCRGSALSELGVIDMDTLREQAFPKDRWMNVRDIDTTLNCAMFAPGTESGGPRGGLPGGTSAGAEGDQDTKERKSDESAAA
ncbi:asparagine synthase-related protein [Streptomyces sp. Ru87]|uniref:asparagine synthase-related protein n=1 Tax=Streptomyces sp. Ru87 TaxID=2044307 RepID=UPI00117E6068|nr:asparagine synthase-related protein [Streptomyces sp. Ru87]